MKHAATLLTIWLSALAGVAVATEPAKPTESAKPAPPPDTDYCARRDADPQKCVIQNGPPNPQFIIHHKPPPPTARKVTPPK
jgi:hypothetical protein